MKTSKLFTAPIPGENLTANSKGYAWHRPPQYPDYDDAFEFFVDDTLSDPEKISAMILMMSNGISALSVTQSLIISKVAQGKISPDMSILIAGPLYKTIVRMMDAAGVDYLTGFDTTEQLQAYASKMKSGEVLVSDKKVKKLTEEKEAEMERITEEAKEEIPVGGLMGAPAPAEEEMTEETPE